MKKANNATLNSITAVLRNRWLHAAAGLAPGLALANPAGLDVVSGAVALANAGNTLTVNQSSASAILNWNSFSIGQDEFVIFNQPSSSAVALNRVLGGSMSELLGSLQANGRVFLINPAGILVGQGAQIDVNSFIASTQNITDADFLAGNATGRYVFSGNSAKGVVNNGSVSAADGGYVVLLGDSVKNTGLIEATKGTVVLASGSAMTLDITGNGLVSYTVDQAALSDASGVENLGSVLADGGKVVMTADVARNTAKAAVNNTGFVSARSIIEGKNGEIILSGKGGDVVNAGTLDASGTAASPNGGKVRITSDRNITLADGSLIKATGSGLLGRGGNVRVIADDTLLFTRGATIQGRGGLGGGFVELSGHKALRVRGAVDLGRGGHLLLDPTTLTVVNGGDGNAAGTGGTNATVYEAFIEDQLKAGTDVTLVASEYINVDDLADGVLDGRDTDVYGGVGNGGSLFMGIGYINANEAAATYGYVAGGEAGANFTRAAGRDGYGIVFDDPNNTVYVDGNIDIVGGYAYGDLTLGKFVAGGDVYIINAQDIDTGDITARGGDLDIESTYGDVILDNVTVIARNAENGIATADIYAGGSVALGVGDTISVIGYGGSSDEAGASLDLEAGYDITMEGTINVRAFALSMTDTETVGEFGYSYVTTTTANAGFAEAFLDANDDVYVSGAIGVYGAGGALIDISGDDAYAGGSNDGVLITGTLNAHSTAGYFTTTVTRGFFDDGDTEITPLGFERTTQYAGLGRIEISAGNYGDITIASSAKLNASGFGGRGNRKEIRSFGIGIGSDFKAGGAEIDIDTAHGDVLIDGDLSLRGFSATTVQFSQEYGGNLDDSRSENRNGVTRLDITAAEYGDIVLGEYSSVTVRAIGNASVNIGSSSADFTDVTLNGDFDVDVKAGYSDSLNHFTSSGYAVTDRDHADTGSFRMNVNAGDDLSVGATASIKVRTEGDARLNFRASNDYVGDAFVVTDILPPPEFTDGDDILVGFYTDGIFIEGDIDVVASAGYEFGTQTSMGQDGYTAFTSRYESRRSEAEIGFFGNNNAADVYITESASIALTDFGGNSENVAATLQVMTSGDVVIDGDIVITGNRGTSLYTSRRNNGDGTYDVELDQSDRGGARFTVGGWSDPNSVTIGESAGITLNGNGEAKFEIFGDSEGDSSVDIAGTIVVNSGRGTESSDYRTVNARNVLIGSPDNYRFDGGTANVTIEGGTVRVRSPLTVNAQGEVDIHLEAFGNNNFNPLRLSEVGPTATCDNVDLCVEGVTVNIVRPSTVHMTDVSEDGTRVVTSDYVNFAPVHVDLFAENSSGDIYVGEGGFDIEAAGSLKLHVFAGENSDGDSNITVDGPVRLAATDATITVDVKDVYSQVIIIPEMPARFESESTYINGSFVGSFVEAEFDANDDIRILSGLSATGGDVFVDIDSSSGDVFVGGPIAITATGTRTAVIGSHEYLMGTYAGYTATGPVTITRDDEQTVNLTVNGGSAYLSIEGDDISVRGAINVRGVSEASVYLDASSDVFIGDSVYDAGLGEYVDIAYNVSAVATGGRYNGRFTDRFLEDGEEVTNTSTVDIRGGSALLDMDASEGGAFAGAITVQAPSEATFNLEASDGSVGNVVVRAQGGTQSFTGRLPSFEFLDTEDFEDFQFLVDQPELPDHPEASVLLNDNESGIDLASLLVRADGDINIGGSGTIEVEGNVGAFAGRNLSLNEESCGGDIELTAQNITLQAGLAGDSSDGDSIGDVHVSNTDLTARDVLSITATDDVELGAFEDEITLTADGLGVSAGDNVFAQYATFYIGDGVAPFGTDIALNTALQTMAPQVQPDSRSPNFAVSGKTVYLSPDNFHMNGYGPEDGDSMGLGDHMLIRTDNLFFTGNGKFDVAYDVTVNFRTFTTNGSIGLEALDSDGDTHHNQDLNLTVESHLSRFPDEIVIAPTECEENSECVPSPGSTFPEGPTDTSFVLGDGLNSGAIIVGETQTEVQPLEDGDDPTFVAMPFDLDEFPLSNDNLVCVTTGTTVGCSTPPVITTGLVAVLVPVVASLPPDQKIIIDKLYEKDLEDKKENPVVAGAPDAKNDKETQFKTRNSGDSTTLECKA